MKFSLSFEVLDRAVSKMGAPVVEIDLWSGGSGIELDLDKQLSTSGGVDIPLADIVANNGLLDYKGRQVVLFIPDHGVNVELALADGAQGRKFHVGECKTLVDMRQRNRFERYSATNNLSGEFEIFGTSALGQALKGKVRLNVCRNCLTMLNFKGYSNLPGPRRNQLVERFSMEEFFSTYSSVFNYHPKLNDRQTAGYTADWEQVSSQVRHEVNYTCQECHVELRQHRNLLHVHHRNGVKSDNTRSNLIALCADCHRKAPFHEHMSLRHDDVVTLNRLRKQQGVIEKIDIQDWDAAIKLADPAVHGVLDHCRRRLRTVPEVGYELANAAGEVVAELELAWPTKRVGVYVGDPVVFPDWKLLNLAQALQYFGK